MTEKNLTAEVNLMGDLNNTQAAREHLEIKPESSFIGRTLAISSSEDTPEIRDTYRPFLVNDEVASSDWISKLELGTVMKLMVEDLKRTGGDRLKVLVLVGSLRRRSDAP
jgi:arsenic resistance protein ArsH